MQQILLIFGKKTTYTALLGPTRLLIFEKSATYTIKSSYTIIWQVYMVFFLKILVMMILKTTTLNSSKDPMKQQLTVGIRTK